MGWFLVDASLIGQDVVDNIKRADPAGRVLMMGATRRGKTLDTWAPGVQTAKPEPAPAAGQRGAPASSISFL